MTIRRTIAQLSVVGCLLLGLSAPTWATCTKPSGTYAGIFSGATYNSSGAMSALFATEMTVTVSANGSGTETETGKRNIGAGGAQYTSSTTFTAAQNVFNTTTCQGIVTLANGRSFIYASTNSGAEIRVTDYTNDGTVLVGVALLQKI
jgi:hypothetical protein